MKRHSLLACLLAALLLMGLLGCGTPQQRRSRLPL